MRLSKPAGHFALFALLIFVWGMSVEAASGQPFTFTPLSTDVSRLSYGSVSLADIDADGRYDLFFTGNPESATPYQPRSGVAINTSPGGSEDRRISFDITSLETETWLGRASPIDFDMDGDLDFLLTGTQSEVAPFESRAVLYLADGGWSPADVDIVGVHSSVVRWADYDNDGDPDLLVMGRTSSHEHSVTLYRNDAGQSVTPVDTPFPALAFGDAAWADYDLDGDLDLAISGAMKNGQFVSTLFRNDGDGAFQEVSVQLPALGFSALSWADYDSDGDPDLAISGARLGAVETFVGVTKLFRNDGGTFTDISGNALSGAFYGGITWTDKDLDGDLDLFVMGRTSMAGNHIGLIYENEGGAFTPVTGLVGTSTSNAEWGDIDGDNDADAVISGVSLQGIPFTRIYRNDTRLVNAPPSPPQGLGSTVDGGNVLLAWNAPGDDMTPASGLRYAVRVGTSAGASDVVNAYADNETGRRILPGFGNVPSGTSLRLLGLASGIYFWSVQAIDNSLVGSSFASEQQFTIVSGGKISTAVDADELPARTALHAVYPNPFRDGTTIAFDLAGAGRVRLSVFDVLGKELGAILDEVRGAGRHTVTWDGETPGGRLGSGVYFLRIRTSDESASTRLVVVR